MAFAFGFQILLRFFRLQHDRDRFGEAFRHHFPENFQLAVSSHFAEGVWRRWRYHLVFVDTGLSLSALECVPFATRSEGGLEGAVLRLTPFDWTMALF